MAERSGLVFAPNRRAEAEAGIARAMKRAGADDLAAYLVLVRRDGAALDDLVDELTVGETHFMRDPDQMDLIRREVFPALKRRRDAGAAARVWSAGCATGEEAYSLAILLEEEGLDDGAVVLGTDLSAAALEKARAGSYSDWSMRGVSGQFLQDYFRHVRGRRILVDRIRNKVRFERLNLVGPEDYAAAGAFGMDLILCRNVLIYFDHETAGRIARATVRLPGRRRSAAHRGCRPAPRRIRPLRSRGDARGPRVPAPPRRTGRGRAGDGSPRPLRRRPWRPDRCREPVADREEPAPPKASPPAEPDLGREAFVRVMGHANAKGRSKRNGSRRRRFAATLWTPTCTTCGPRSSWPWTATRRRKHEAQRALYLDPSLAVAHFLLGTILRKRGARPGALRAFRNVRDLCAARPSDEEVPAGAGERTGALHSAASAEMERLEVTVG